jgi:hypothetical protein
MDAAAAPVKAGMSFGLLLVALFFIITVVGSPIGIAILILGSLGLNKRPQHGVHCATCGSYYQSSQVRHLQPQARVAFKTQKIPWKKWIL